MARTDTHGSRFSFRRMGLIAQRDFMGYVRTWGFWLTALGPFIGIIFGLGFPLLMYQSEPAHYASILDDTGTYASDIKAYYAKENENQIKESLKQTAKIVIPRANRDEFERILDEDGVEAAKAFRAKTSPWLSDAGAEPTSKLEIVDPPADTMETLLPYIRGDKMISIDGSPAKLSGVLHLQDTDDGLLAEYWSTSPTTGPLVSLTNRYFSSRAQEEILQKAGLTRERLSAARKDAPKVSAYNPDKTEGGDGGQKVSIRDFVPYMVGAGLSMLLWFTVFTGAYMLLVSMVEEKINKVLEMLLASTQFSEIFFGKLAGVAALTLASLLPWIVLGVIAFQGAMHFGDGVLVEGLNQAVSTQMLTFLPIFFLLGYVFYGSIFIALGSLAESMQDASTLMTPMVLLLTACILIVPIGIAYPDSPLLVWAAYFPFSAPFAAVMRLPGDPPLWQTMGSVLVLILSSALVVKLSHNIFQYGVLSGSGVSGVKSWFSRRFKRKPKTTN